MRMLDYIQILIALGSILLEFESFRNARRLFEAKSRKDEWKKVLLGTYPIPIIFFLSLCGVGYLICSIVWMFDPRLPIRVAGIALVGMSGLGLLMRKLSLERVWLRPLIVRVDAVISIACLLTVILVKGVLA